ncbi:MAG: hypothetical protein WBF58_23150 [Xanthobacteraceae bacterium]
MVVYAAAALFELFQGQEAIIDLEYKTSELQFAKNIDDFRHGRIDLFVDAGPTDGLIFIEFKRYMNFLSITSDIDRVASLTQGAKAVGLKSSGYVAGPLYLDEGQENTFRQSYENKLVTSLWPQHRVIPRIGVEQTLPCKVHNNKDGILDRHLAVVVEIATL